MSGRRRPDPLAGEVPEAVQWHEGMLLAPQHFQQEARRIEALVNLGLRAAVPYLWGIWRLEIDDALLVSGLFRVTALEALMPDGMPVAHPRTGSEDLELDCTGLEAVLLRAPVTLHLAVPALTDHAAADGALRRYVSVEDGMVVDQNLGENPVPIPRLRAAAVLLATDSPLVGPGASYVSLPVAVVGMVDGRLQRLDYQPPILRVTRSAPIHAIAEEVVGDMREKATALARRIRQAAEGDMVESTDVAAALRALVAPLPRLEAMLSDDATSPHDLYLQMCDALGAAAAVDFDLAPPSPPAYQHEDAMPAFAGLRRMICGAFGRLGRARRLIPFDAIGDGAFRITPERIDDLRDPFLVVLTGGLAEAVDRTALWGEEAAIAGAGQMHGVQLNRVRGATRRMVDRPQSLDFAVPPRSVVFEVARDPRYLAAGEAIEIRHPDGAGAEGEPVRIALVASADAAAEAPDDEPDTPEGARP